MRDFEVSRKAGRVVHEVQTIEIQAESKEEALFKAESASPWEWTSEEELDDYIDYADDYEVVDWGEDELAVIEA